MHRRLAATFLVLLLAGAACSDDDKGDTGDNGTGATTVAVPPSDGSGGTAPGGGSLAPSTTFIPDCAGKPSAQDLSAAVGVPLDEGFVTGAGTCQFTGLNDQSRSLTLSHYTDPGDRASFLDLIDSLGPSAPANDPTVADAQVAPTGFVYVVTADSIYVVQPLLTDASPQEQVPLALAVLRIWLTI